jgi:NADH:ubiquinone oxidoreductase subunit 6 (subunit J)
MYGFSFPQAITLVTGQFLSTESLLNVPLFVFLLLFLLLTLCSVVVKQKFKTLPVGIKLKRNGKFLPVLAYHIIKMYGFAFRQFFLLLFA